MTTSTSVDETDDSQTSGAAAANRHHSPPPPPSDAADAAASFDASLWQPRGHAMDVFLPSPPPPIAADAQSRLKRVQFNNATTVHRPNERRKGELRSARRCRKSRCSDEEDVWIKRSPSPQTRPKLVALSSNVQPVAATSAAANRHLVSSADTTEASSRSRRRFSLDCMQDENSVCVT